MADEEPGRRLPTAVGPELQYLRTLATQDGTATRVEAVDLPDVDLPPVVRDEPLELPDGLVYEGVLGRGAMGEVHRVRDVRLNRRMALKVLKWTFHHRGSSVQRFLDEAQATAQLQHPGIVPVHDLGVLPDGRAYFTMREVAGRTLGEVVGEVHQSSTPDGWRRGRSGTTFRRLVEHLRIASEAVGYAHQRGVVHRDLKPDNIMVGPHGEVFVMDWGIAKLVGRAELGGEEVLQLTGRTEATQVGTVFGTPAYMAPEQAAGRTRDVDARTDVYALGAVLFAILYGERPYRGYTARSLISRVASCIPPGVPDRPGPPVPEALEEIRARAMAAEPTARFQDAAAFAQAIVAWLDGSARRQRALALVEQASGTLPLVNNLRADAVSLRTNAGHALDEIPAWAPESDKLGAWRTLERAAHLDAEADLLEVEVDRLLLGALAHDGECQEARVALADRWRDQHHRAEVERDAAEARRAEAQLRGHLAALPAGHPSRRRHERYLDGRARISLSTVPQGVPVHIDRYEERGRRLVPVPVGELGPTPLDAVELPHGSYVLRLQAPGGTVRLPVLLDRLEHFRLVDEQGQERDLVLPAPDALGPLDVFVPLGWAWLGGDPSAIGSLPRRRVWLESFVMRRFPITNREYKAFLDDLVRQGRRDEALAHVPREKAGTVGDVGAAIYGQHTDGTFLLRPDADGDPWDPDHAVANVTWHGATAYAAWLAERTGLPWRLPTSQEWEKAGRGVDARVYPWGDLHDASWCCMRDSHRGRPRISEVDTFPVDESPYGVRGLAGNVRDWCSDQVADGRKIDRGGFWLGNAREARLADQHEHVPDHRAAEIGFRVCRSLHTTRPALSGS